MRKAALVLVVLAVVLAGCASGAEPSLHEKVGTLQTPTTVKSTTTAKATTTATAAARAWVEVASFTGSASKNTEPFELTGGPVRMTYTVEGDTLMAAFYVEPEGKDIMKEGGFPVVMVSEASSDETRINKDAGMYYLSVNAANCDWSVRIEEQK